MKEFCIYHTRIEGHESSNRKTRETVRTETPPVARVPVLYTLDGQGTQFRACVTRRNHEESIHDEGPGLGRMRGKVNS